MRKQCTHFKLKPVKPGRVNIHVKCHLPLLTFLCENCLKFIQSCVNGSEKKDRCYSDEVCLGFNGRMSEGDSVGESIHGKPSVVAVFFTRIGQVKMPLPSVCPFLFEKHCLRCFTLLP